MQHIIGFAHRGAPQGRADHNALSAFARALALGATGLESDIGLTADGIPVLFHRGLSIRRQRRPEAVPRSRLPASIPSLVDLYETCGTDFELSLDMANPRAAEAVVAVAAEYGALDRLWLTYWRMPEVQRWRRLWPHVHLVYPALPVAPGSAIRLANRLSSAGVDVLNVHYRLCRPNLVEHAHHRQLRIFAWGIRSAGALDRAIARGVDGVYCDNVEEMVNALSG